LGVVEQYCVQKPVIGIAMQQLGQRTRYQSLIRGAWGSYACLHPEKAIAGQMTVDQVVEKLRRAV
jgi:3-dehydroquinate dehydratase